MNWFEVKRTEGKCVIKITGVITAAQDAATLISEVGDAQDILVVINSTGGCLMRAVAVYDFLRPLKPLVRILNDCASASSVIAMAGEKIEIIGNGNILVHNVTLNVIGGSDALRKAAETVAIYEHQLLQIYARRTRQPESVIRDWISKDSWFTAAEALAVGLVDQVIEAESPFAWSDPIVGADGKAVPDDSAHRLLLDLLTAFGPVTTTSKASLARDLHYWFRTHVQETPKTL